jgi:mevalonate kinase
MTSASACAKIILCGEHAVVYGQPAIAVPVSSLRATVTAQPAATFQIHLADMNEVLTLASEHPIAEVARWVLAHLQQDPPLAELHIQSAIPIASGLGSGAALATAVARTLFLLLGAVPTPETINPLVYETEKLFHGTPSGIDNTVIAYEQPVYFIKGQPIEPLAIRGQFHFLIADTGIAAPTKVSVGDVRTLYEQDRARIQPLLNAIGRISTQVRGALEQGKADILGSLMNENHALLQRLTVSAPELDVLVDAARAAGALGAKLSGGGRGGNMIALVPAVQMAIIETALRQAGAVRVIQTTVQA